MSKPRGVYKLLNWAQYNESLKPPDVVVGSVLADGAYDTKACYAAIIASGAKPIIPAHKSMSMSFCKSRQGTIHHQRI